MKPPLIFVWLCDVVESGFKMSAIVRIILIAGAVELMTAMPFQTALSAGSNRAAVSEPIPPQGTKTDAGAFDDRGSEQHPLFARIISSSDRAAIAARVEKDRDEESANRRIAFWTKVSAIVAVLMFLAGLGQIALFVWQLRLIRKSLDDAKTAAQAAVDANNLTRDIFVANQRPWLAIEGIGFSKSFELHKQVVQSECAVALRNKGRSPAEMIVVSANFLLEGSGISLTALKQHEKRVDEFRTNSAIYVFGNPTFSMFPDEVAARNAEISAKVSGHFDTVRVFCSVMASYRNPGVADWCVSARLYRVSYKSTKSVDEFELNDSVFEPNYVVGDIIHEGNITT